ncbi:general secretion pathway protein GspE [Clostridium tetani]|uniref:General secretion pathway protein E n=1 Tax=Clostridium tetani (strain Massachusetts / E88) TaxID=212717 RepID=Q894E4_CLOTE|nr:GspE/PulE family protein [Clostridium tetani]AAO36148.1 general secretion pathway protein E [Clostridium tetani E88]AVP54144.1 type II/IV secretion system protein [Clostridium tetani]KGI37893.1 hypothetical protein KY52_10165 [Clostridium tetani]KGI39821.1 hypothetical protein LA33_03745 [Clostridium tetani ATCC 9441]KGI43847.1 hypothetical protein KY55_05340 [Clostridium tetani]
MSELKYNFTVNTDAIESIPINIAEKYLIFPYDIDHKFIYIMSSKKLLTYEEEEIKFMAGKDLKSYTEDSNYIRECINKFYYKKEAIYITNISKENKSKYTKQDYEYLEDENSPGVKMLNYFLKEAIFKKASDIHIEPFEGKAIVRFRIDGVLHEFWKLSQELYRQIKGRIKILSNMDIAEKRYPQDGKFKFNFYKKDLDIRVSTMPTLYDEKIVMRLLYKSEVLIKLKDLGFYGESFHEIKKISKYSSGMILVTGPTGSGKTTTLYSIINEMDKKHRNIITIEEPVEYSMDGVNQINIREKIGMTFSNVLKYTLRQDPDVIMIGEIRDKETAKIAIRASLTGHLVLASLHTKDPLSSIIRLIDMGVPDYLLMEALNAIISQRLVRKLCPFCKEKFFYEAMNSEIYKKVGCEKCNDTGYLGRVLIYEKVILDEDIKEMVLKGCNMNEIRKYTLEKNKTNLEENALNLIKKGKTSIEELEKLNF